ncbi:glycoside hydrolase family 2 TIM barrel-domain containing protein [Paenibacillus camerounensis]|uniref:glycoside hydrolase family 2 TIM barrel-domain containing protein n=1 Tax=Paenibacillus camerounensis TaxID=1243663 RepID=UPI001FCBB367|nr:glycoside hydrolase family 2 TIM barrel-domain containing protein [Paenibacillus camerounensis]
MINLKGKWKLQLDADKQGLVLPFSDTIDLPGTTSFALKGPKNEKTLISALTDEYLFEGQAWFSREIEIPEELAGKSCRLYLERTRMTTLYLDGAEIGSRDSLNTAHIYDLGKLAAGNHTVTVCVSNTGYPTKGGHLTSEDTQTNWNGITGRLELQFFGEAYLSDIRLTADVANRSVRITAILNGSAETELNITAVSFNGAEGAGHSAEEQIYTVEPGPFSINYSLGADALLWSEFAPNLYRVKLTLNSGGDSTPADHNELIFGLREFKADGDKFAINGQKTFLRGKHDGLIFPLTGYAPTDVEAWVRILGISKSYGINHYRFHTCCPPEAAFTAADLLGIYMEPELPFWGTITEPSDDNHNQAEQDYLVSEGYAILQAFGNHPSFVMMSLGNELWGSRAKIDSILKEYKAFDSRPLYTQGSNNHQWVPEILEHEDFFCGVRFSRSRLFRGSYAMCDAPLGHVQTAVPSTMKDYDDQFVPPAQVKDADEGAGAGGEIQIQYGTEAKTVQADDASGEWIPHIPVISHEIGQYATFPDFEEIAKYSGPLKAKNFEIFRERLEKNGLGHLAAQYFAASGKLAAACYKEELEAAFRTRRLAGFQLLDLQDFSGQGTALVGILDAFMDSKGMITAEEWRTFCNDAVLLARFPKFNYVSGELFHADVELSWFRGAAPDRLELSWELGGDNGILGSGTAVADSAAEANYYQIGVVDLLLPAVDAMTAVRLNLQIAGTDIHKSYDLWIYPELTSTGLDGVHVFKELGAEAQALLEQGGNVLLMPNPDSLNNAVQGFYSTDFWCYPMFRSISESMNRPVPVGTMGLLIDNSHPVLRSFPSEEHSTYPWWSIIEHSKSLILDGTDQSWSPVVRTIDNFERNHRLGFLLECRVGTGKLLICPLDADKAAETPEGRQFLASLTGYMGSEEFNPEYVSTIEELQRMIQ